jgi:hypothetical protein
VRLSIGQPLNELGMLARFETVLEDFERARHIAATGDAGSRPGKTVEQMTPTG